ncbi:hypothetical protein KTT_44440 [Tengunoibacter tsumagoiensis]|uniref:Uncharacterized protein n=1 Tax=Tengunoibacter tsumagoiensis TaxID=2014871 RepID=A0A402A6E3_9CHLR|nr:hypothetical protein KTT_44440 [Tengunoibacter tsumagoiensis]
MNAFSRYGAVQCAGCRIDVLRCLSDSWKISEQLMSIAGVLRGYHLLRYAQGM